MTVHRNPSSNINACILEALPMHGYIGFHKYRIILRPGLAIDNVEQYSVTTHTNSPTNECVYN
jgi:hypothetical protein